MVHAAQAKAKLGMVGLIAIRSMSAAGSQARFPQPPVDHICPVKTSSVHSGGDAG